MQTLNGITQYTRADLDREAKAIALTHSKRESNGKPFDVSWEILITPFGIHKDAVSVNLVVSYAANGRDNKCGVYHVNEAL